MTLSLPDLRPSQNGVEYRIFAAPSIEWRGAGDGNGFLLDGVAAVFDQTTELYSSKWLRVTEDIAPDAFDDVLAANPDVHLNINHDMSMPMARTGRSAHTMGGLELTKTDTGLRAFARVNPKASYVSDLAVMMGDGVVDQMSFAFTIGDEQLTTTEADGVSTEHFRILRVSQLYDVCVCAQGAYTQTSVALHSRMARHGRTIDVGQPGIVAPSGVGGHLSVAPPGVGGVLDPGIAARRLRIARLRSYAIPTIKECK